MPSNADSYEIIINRIKEFEKECFENLTNQKMDEITSEQVVCSDDIDVLYDKLVGIKKMLFCEKTLFFVKKPVLQNGT